MDPPWGNETFRLFRFEAQLLAPRPIGRSIPRAACDEKNREGGQLGGHWQLHQLGVSENRGTPKSSILIRFSTINHPFWGTPISGNIQLHPPNNQLFIFGDKIGEVAGWRGTIFLLGFYEMVVFGATKSCIAIYIWCSDIKSGNDLIEKVSIQIQNDWRNML